MRGCHIIVNNRINTSTIFCINCYYTRSSSFISNITFWIYFSYLFIVPQISFTWVSRGVVVVITIIAVIVAMQGAPSANGAAQGKSFLDVVMSLVSFAWGGFGACFGPIMLLALFWKRTTLPGAIAGMLVGGITAFVWKFYLSGFSAEIFQIYELVPGFVLSFATIVIVSLCTKAPSKEIQEEFDQVENTRLSDIKL